MAFEIAARLVGAGTNPITQDGSKVVNAITVLGHDQVMLKVTVAEVKRTVIKQLGMNLSGSLGYGATVLDSTMPASFRSTEPTQRLHCRAFPVGKGHPAGHGASRRDPHAGRADLTAISGESATFIAGGKFPYPTPPNTLGGAAVRRIR